MHLGQKIKILRVIAGLTQENLAYKVNKTRALISHIEQTGSINHYTLLSILKIFNITTEEFEDFDGKTHPNNRQELIKNETILFEIKELKQQLINYQKENKILKELAMYQKKIIQTLEKARK